MEEKVDVICLFDSLVLGTLNIPKLCDDRKQAFNVFGANANL